MRGTFGQTLSVSSSLRYAKSSNSPGTILEFSPRRLSRYSVPSEGAAHGIPACGHNSDMLRA